MDSRHNLAGVAFFSVVINSRLTKEVKGAIISDDDLIEVQHNWLTDKTPVPKYYFSIPALGTWYDTDTDTSYIEVASLFGDLNAAFKAGRANGQKAIYDLLVGEVIFID